MGKRRVDEQAAVTTVPDTARPFMRWLAEDLTCRQAAVLAIVEDNPGVTVGAVAAVMGVPKPSVTRAVDRLAEFGLLHRSHNAEDRRLVALYAGRMHRTHNAEDRRLMALYAGRKAGKAAPARTGRSTRRGG